MNVFIAREGEEIGEFPRADLEKLAAASRLRASDDYWHDGMEDWGKLVDLLGEKAWTRPPKTERARQRPASERAARSAPAPPAPEPEPESLREWLELFRAQLLSRRVQLLWAGAAVLGFFLLAAIGIHFMNASHARAVPIALSPMNSATKPTASDEEIRDRAAADLRQRIDRLPAQAAPPLHTFFYDVRVEMQETFSPAAPWRATVRGVEDVIDPETQATVRHTDFVLTTDYRHGAWTFVNYHASATDLVRALTTESQDDARTMAPPSLVGMLGLKRDAP